MLKGKYERGTLILLQKIMTVSLSEPLEEKVLNTGYKKIKTLTGGPFLAALL